MTEQGPLPLLLVQAAPDFGPAERALWELATRLPASRYAIRVWLSPEPGLDELSQSLEARGVPVERVGDVRSRWDVRGQAVLWSALRRARPALIHLHGSWPELPRGLGAIARLGGGGHLLVSVQGICAGRPAHLASLRAADRVTVPYRAAVPVVAGALPGGSDAVGVVPNGADLPGAGEVAAARRWREQLGASSSRPLWVAAGRLELSKGHDVLVEALGRLRERGLHFVAAVAGEGSQRAALERRCAALGLETHVRWVGAVDELGPLLAAADAFVLPSRAEGMPLTLAEAMVRGRPVVASDIGGVTDWIEDGVHGFRVSAEDPAALADALARIHAHPDRARRMGAQAAADGEVHLLWPAVIEAYEAQYDETLGLAGFVPAGAAEERRQLTPH